MTEKIILSKWKVTTKLCNECQKWDLFCIGEAHDYFLRSKSRQMMDRGEENAFFTEVQIIWGVPDNFESYYLSNDHSLISNYNVVKWGHTKGIPREKTSSEKYTEISL